MPQPSPDILLDKPPTNVARGDDGLATHVSQNRLWARHMALAEIGALTNGGVANGGMNRQALTPDDTQAKATVIAWAQALGAQAQTDKIGNVFLSLRGSDTTLAPFMTGSHLDTQPAGGRFDGVSGVLAGLEVLEAVTARGTTPARTIKLVIWQNEEGCRFAPTTMGSGVFTGAVDLQTALAAKDAGGTRLQDALATEIAALALPDHGKPDHPAAYLELHIEQGPILETHGLPVGIVTSVQGMRQYRVTISGETGHAGTVPNALRQDAVDSAINLITAIRAQIDDPQDLLRFTVGQFTVSPDVINTIADKVVFTIDLRHPDDARLAEIDGIIAAHSNALPRCNAHLEHLIDVPAVQFDASLVALMKDRANALDINAMCLSSGATHDARHIAGLCPAAMIFTPCRNGASHNPREWAAPADLYQGTRLLAAVAEKLCFDTDDTAAGFPNQNRTKGQQDV